MRKHFDMPANENIRNNKDAIKTCPLFFRYFDFVFH